MVVTGSETVGTHRGKHGIILHYFPVLFCSRHDCLSRECKSPNLNKPVLTFVSWFAYIWTSYSVISQTAMNTETKRSKETLYSNAARAMQTTNSHAVALHQCFSSFRQCSDSHINIYIIQLCSSRKQTVAWKTSPECCSFSSVFFYLCFSLSQPLSLYLNYFYNGEKHLSSRYQESKNGAYSFSVVATSLRDLSQCLNCVGMLIQSFHLFPFIPISALYLAFGSPKPNNTF